MRKFDLYQIHEEERLKLQAPSPNQGPINTALEPERRSKGLFDPVDTILSIPRGAEGFLQDTYGLLDTLVGDTLPDWEQRFLGESQSTIGSLNEGLANFAFGFLTGGQILKGAGVTAKLAQYGTKGRVASAALQGGVADFISFDGHEARLSDLVQAAPALRNIVTGFLASDEEDPELLGRLKNVIEGLGIGVAVDGVLAGLRGIRAGRAARAAGASEEAVAQAAREAVETSRAAPPSRVESGVTSAQGVEDVSAEAVEGYSKKVFHEGIEVDTAPQEIVETLTPADLGLTEDSLKDIAERISKAPTEGLNVNPASLTSEELAERGIIPKGLNLSNVTNYDEAVAAIRVLEQQFEKDILDAPGVARRSVEEIYAEQIQALSSLNNVSQERLLGMLNSTLLNGITDIRKQSARLGAASIAQTQMGDALYKAAKAVADGTAATPQDLAKLQFQAEALSDVIAGIKGMRAETGRALRALQIDVDGAPLDAIQGLLEEGGGEEAVRKFAAKFAAVVESGGLAGGMRLAEVSRGRKALQIVNEYWINGLFGPLTQAVNASSNAVMAVYRPLEQIAGGSIARLLGDTGGSAAVRNGVLQLQYLVDQVGESWRYAKASFDIEGPILSSQGTKFDLSAEELGSFSSAGFSQALGRQVESPALDWIGRNVVRFHSRLLGATDEFFKQMMFRSKIKADAYMKALSQGLQGDEAAKYAVERLEALIKQGQAYNYRTVFEEGITAAKAAGIQTPPKIRQYAREYARQNFDESLSEVAAAALKQAEEATFTAPLQKGTIAKSVQDTVQQHPMLRFMMPFIRTPYNLAVQAGQRTVLSTVPMVTDLLSAAASGNTKGLKSLEGVRSSLLKDMLSGDASRKAQAIGRATAALSTTLLVLSKAAEGTITGRGPSDRAQRKAMEAAGWQEYSIRVGDRYYSYKRFDPFASILGLMADAYEVSAYASPADQAGVEEALTGLMAATANNFTNKTYLTGLSNVIRALQEPDRYVGKEVSKLAATLAVPMQGTLNQLKAGGGDLVERDVRTLLDRMRDRIPGLAEELPPQRDMFGDPIHQSASLGSGVNSAFNLVVPIAYREVSDDAVKKELARLRRGFNPPPSTRGGLDLHGFASASGQTAYDRWGQLHGQVKVQGRTLQTALRRLINSKAYKRLAEEPDEFGESPRHAEIKKVFSRYRRAAWDQVLKEYPELAQTYRNNQRINAARQRGQDITGLLQF